MTISTELSTIPLSATTVSSAGTVRWMSPELMFNQNNPPSRESDCYALGMVIYEVSWLCSSHGLPLTRCQVLTGLQPFHYLGPFAVVIAVQRGERPKKPDNAKSLGFSETLWRLTRACWSESPSTRPTVQQLLCDLQDASHTWVPPLQYPIPDNLDGEITIDFTPSDEWGITPGSLTSSFLALVVSALCVLLLSISWATRPRSCYTCIVNHLVSSP